MLQQKNCKSDHLGGTVSECTKDDDKVALSIEDDYFLDIIEKGFKKIEIIIIFHCVLCQKLCVHLHIQIA